ncbi:stage V sporulation protein SpoVAB [Bacillaceae bacterium]
MKIFDVCLLVLIGLSGGVAVGSGFVAFITVLDIIPRLAQLSYGQSFVRAFEWALILGAVVWTAVDQFDWTLHLTRFTVTVFGACAGMFVGMLAAALTEVLNVLPILAKRIRLEDKLIYFLMAMVFGKVIGSLFQWLYFN